MPSTNKKLTINFHGRYLEMNNIY